MVERDGKRDDLDRMDHAAVVDHPLVRHAHEERAHGRGHHDGLGLLDAQRALALDPHNAVNVLSVAICYGKLAGFSDTRTKLEYSRFVKEYAEQAIALKPDYDYAHHVRGRWNYEVATLGAGTRFLVSVIYGGLPDASTAEAVRQLRRAVEISPTLPAHRVELGLALLADGQRDAARQTLEAALAMHKCEKYDDEAFARARAGLAKLR